MRRARARWCRPPLRSPPAGGSASRPSRPSRSAKATPPRPPPSCQRNRRRSSESAVIVARRSWEFVGGDAHLAQFVEQFLFLALCLVRLTAQFFGLLLRS